MASARDMRSKRSHAPGSGSRAPNAVKLARREAACARILELLEDGPMAAAVLSEQIGVLKTTTYSYLRYMSIDLRSVHRTSQLDEQRRETWALGEDLNLPTREEMMDASFAQRQRTVPAKQVGMERHWLDVALFGAPAQGARA